MDKLMKMAAGKKKSNLSDVEKDAKMSVLHELKKLATDKMKDNLGGLKKVTVASPDKQGLSKGLEAAQAMMEGEEIGESDEEAVAEDLDLAGDRSPEDMSEMSEEEIDAKLQELMEKKKALKSNL